MTAGIVAGMKVGMEDAIALSGVPLCMLFGAAGMDDWVWSAASIVSVVLVRRRFATFAVLAGIIPAIYTTMYGSFSLTGQLMAVGAAFLCGASRVRHCRLIGLASCLLPAVAFSTHLLIIHSMDWTMPVAGLFAGSLMLASWQAGRLNHAKDMRLEAEEARRIMAERDSDMRARLAVLEERMRISHEMHDILAHTLTGITVQAESGKVTTPDPASRAVFTDISRASREAVTDLRALLASDMCSSYQPEPTLDQFDRLIDEYRQCGLAIEVHDDRDRALGLPVGLSHAVYRVAEECLTNAMRYARPRCVDMTLNIASDEILLHCENLTEPGSSGGEAGERRYGHGLDGIAWRCEQYGGHASYAQTDGLFQIDAVWPVSGEVSLCGIGRGRTGDSR